MSTLYAQQLTHQYGDKLVLDHIDIAVHSGDCAQMTPGDIYGILGPNGAGKTTLFKNLVGLIQPKSGAIKLDKTDITNFHLSQRAALGLIYLPQEPSIFPGLTVEENLLAVAQCASPTTENDVPTIKQSFQLESMWHQKANTLSGGQRRRVEIARSILLHPQFILLDEPFAGIDPMAIADIKSILKDLSLQSIGIIITDHQVRETLTLCTKASLLHQGKILCEGSPETLVNDPRAKATYFGDQY